MFNSSTYITVQLSAHKTCIVQTCGHTFPVKESHYFMIYIETMVKINIP